MIVRHGLTDDVAFEVEAALIDVFPDATNKTAGKNSGDYGEAMVYEIIERYAAPEVTFRHDVVLVDVSRSFHKGQENLYDATRFQWRIDKKRAERADYILAVSKGVIRGVFVAQRWLPAADSCFAALALERATSGFEGGALAGRYGFIGIEASEEVSRLYIGHRLPDVMRKKGAQWSFRYASAE